MARSTNRSTVAAPYPIILSLCVTPPRNMGAYVRGERRHGLARLDARIECDAPDAPNMRGRRRLGEWYQ
jgi:hypothetical protein